MLRRSFVVGFSFFFGKNLFPRGADLFLFCGGSRLASSLFSFVWRVLADAACGRPSPCAHGRRKGTGWRFHTAPRARNKRKRHTNRANKKRYPRQTHAQHIRHMREEKCCLVPKKRAGRWARPVTLFSHIIKTRRKKGGLVPRRRFARWMTGQKPQRDTLLHCLWSLLFLLV